MRSRTPEATRAKTAHTALLLCVASAIGCATLQPHAGAAVEQAAATEDAASLRFVEGTPNGLVLRLTTDVDADQLVLFRAQDDAEPVVLQTVDLTNALRQALSDGVDSVDSTIVPGQFRYQFALVRDGEFVAQSTIVDVYWRVPPPRTEPVVRAAFSDAVELAWRTPHDARAVVERRDVLDQTSEFARVATVAAGQGVWVDRDVAAGQVWSYRVTLAFEHDGEFLQYGVVSEEVYASTPESQ